MILTMASSVSKKRTRGFLCVRRESWMQMNSIESLRVNDRVLYRNESLGTISAIITRIITEDYVWIQFDGEDTCWHFADKKQLSIQS